MVPRLRSALVGIVTMGDLHLFETLKDVDTSVAVSEAMTANPVTVAPGDMLDEVAATMAERKLGSVVVVENDEIRGIFTNIDALKALLHQWKKTP